MLGIDVLIKSLRKKNKINSKFRKCLLYWGMKANTRIVSKKLRIKWKV